MTGEFSGRFGTLSYFVLVLLCFFWSFHADICPCSIARTLWTVPLDDESDEEDDGLDLFFDARDTLEELCLPSLELAATSKPRPSNVFLGKENLYHEAQVTLGAAVATLFVFFLTHHLSKSTFQDLLDILQLLLPSGNLLPKKLDTFLGLFSSVGDRLVFHEFCETCHHLFSLSETRCPKCNTWRYQGSQADQAKKKKKTFFLELPIQRDVEELFKGRLDYFLFYFF